MRVIKDLRFVLGLYRYLDKRLRVLVNGLVAMIALPITAIVLVTSHGAFGESKPPVVLNVRTPAVHSEPAPAYVPLPPTTAWPARGAITASFGSRTPAQLHHSGIDIGGHYGDPITAFRAGTVIVAEQRTINSTGLGKYVMVDHGGGVVSVYGHLSSITTTVGQQVNTQTVIGKEGSTGQAYGVHLHFEIRINGKSVNPQYQIAGIPPR